MDNIYFHRLTDDHISIKSKCLFCLKRLSKSKVVENESSSEKSSSIKKLTVDDATIVRNAVKNRKCFEVLCDRLYIDNSNYLNCNDENQHQDEIGIFTKPLPLCGSCENLHQDIYQLHCQIKQLDRLIFERVSRVREVIEESEKSSDFANSTANFNHNHGLHQWFRSEILKTVRKPSSSSSNSRSVPIRNETKLQTEVKVEIDVDAEVTQRELEINEQIEVEAPDHDDDVDGEYDDDDPLGGVEVGTDEHENDLDDDYEDNEDNEEIDSDDSYQPKLMKRPKVDRVKVQRQNDQESGQKRKRMLKCHICDLEVKNHDSLMNHYDEVHPEEEKFTCRFCKKYFKYHCQCITHQVTHTKEKPFSCDFPGCGRKYSQDCSLRKHVREVHTSGNDSNKSKVTERRFPCDVENCLKKFLNKTSLRSHWFMAHSERRLMKVICHGVEGEGHCGVKLKYFNFWNHNRKMHGGEAVKSEPFLEDDDDKVHAKDKNRRHNQDVKCHLCWQEIPEGKVGIDQHFQQCHPGKSPKECGVCGLKFRAFSICKQHALRHCGDWMKSFHCGHAGCDAKFFTVSELTKHKQRHDYNDGELPQPWMCDQCDKKFCEKNELQNHQRVHLAPDEKLNQGFSCEICGKILVTKTSLGSHLKTHEPESERRSRNVCEFCGKSFLGRKIYLHHMKLKHWKKTPHKCVYPGCTKEFVEMGELRKHVRAAHEKQKPFKCPLCEQCFMHQNTRSRHVKEVHYKQNCRYRHRTSSNKNRRVTQNFNVQIGVKTETDSVHGT